MKNKFLSLSPPFSVSWHRENELMRKLLPCISSTSISDLSLEVCDTFHVVFSIYSCSLRGFFVFSADVNAVKTLWMTVYERLCEIICGTKGKKKIFLNQYSKNLNH